MVLDAIPVVTCMNALLNLCLPKYPSAKYLAATGADSTGDPYGMDPYGTDPS